MPPMAATAVTTDSITRRFAIVCGVLGQYVNDDAPAAVVQERNAPVGRAQQLTIFYGGKVVVLDGCTPARAAELIRYTAAAAEGAPESAPVDMPIARKASLRRFLAKRKDRATAAATVPYGRPEQAPAKNGKTEARSEEASFWLALGSLGDMHARGDHLNITL